MQDHKAPSLGLLLAESRALPHYLRYRLRGLRTDHLPSGNGAPVIVIPGFGASDTTTRPLRHALTALGYDVSGWHQGKNKGMTRPISDGLKAMLASTYARHEMPVTLIGWSLGGVFARELARKQPQQVQQVFSLGSPIGGHPHANNVTALFALFNPAARQPPDMDAFHQRSIAPDVPCTAIYSKSDGIVSWRCCLEQPAAHTQNVEVKGPHCGFPWNQQVLDVLAKAMAVTN